jgi:tRNA threonylcarbamoyladenosine biosynthesis protein TsaE
VRIADAYCLKSERVAPRLDASGKSVVIRLRYSVLHEPNHSRSGVSRHSAAKREVAINLPDEAATTIFAARLARALQPGLVIYLRGNLGAGKTTLVRALLRNLGYTGHVKSPTYTLIERYEVAGLHLRHFDLYRFRDAEEWEGSGFRDEFDGRNICVVEWPEQATGLLPPADVSLTFEILQDGRNVLLHAYTDAGQKCLSAL